MHHINHRPSWLTALLVRSDPLGPLRLWQWVQSCQLLLPRVMMKMLAQALTQVPSPREPAGL